MKAFAFLLITGAAVAGAVSMAASTISPPSLGSINNDAMTMQRCRARLALPMNARPKDDDPRVDLDAVCRGMLLTEHLPQSHATSAAHR